MTPDLTAAFFQTVGVQRFLHSLREDLEQGRSLLLLLPARIDPTRVWAAISGELWRRNFSIKEIAVDNLSADGALAASLGDKLGVKWPTTSTPQTAANLVFCKGLPDIVQLEGFDRLKLESRKLWIDFLRLWGQAAQTTMDGRSSPPALCLLVPAHVLLPNVPETNVRLAVRWWWGVLSALEIRLLCRFYDDDVRPAALWREHVMPAIAGDDVGFVERFWDDLYLESDLLIGRLTTFAKERGWTEKSLRGWIGDFLLTDFHLVNTGNPVPPKSAQELWARGLVQWTQEHGLELHSAALAVLGRREDLLHRLWTGQAALLLPLINSARLKLCEHLTTCYGNDWPVRWHRPDNLEEDNAVSGNPLTCQLGHAAFLLRRCDMLRPERRWLRLIEHSRWIRNELAHYRPIRYVDFELFWQEVREVES